MKVKVQGTVSNSDGTTWVRCFPTEAADQLAAKTAGITSFTVTVELGEVRLTNGSTLDGLVPEGEPVARKDGHGLSQRLGGSISAIQLRRVVGLAAGATVTTVD